MAQTEQGLSVRLETDQELEEPPAPDERPLNGPAELGDLRDEFVDAFNARDLDAVLAIVCDDVECPDRGVSDARGLGTELSAIWERSPSAILTRAFLDGEPCAVAWLPDEQGWCRAALLCFGVDGSDPDRPLLDVVSMPEDADALDRAEADDPDGEDLDEGATWEEWEAGEDPTAQPRR